MDQFSRIIGIKNVSADNYFFESCYLPWISFKNEKQVEAVNKYIYLKAKIFFRQILDLQLPGFNFQSNYISYHQIITDLDFKKTQIKYFYSNIFSCLGERDRESKLVFIPRWGITFDENNCPIETSFLPSSYIPSPASKINFTPLKYFSENREVSFIRYGDIRANDEPIFYYIYFTMQEILDQIRVLDSF